VSLTFAEKKRQLDALRRAQNWTDAEYQSRLEALQRQHAGPTSPSAPEARAERGGRTRTARLRPRIPVEEDFLVAPYRFVEVANAVAKPPDSVRNALEKNEPDLLCSPLDDGYCGEIEVTFASETPLLIGQTEKDSVVPFGFDGDKGREYWVPGSSLRGMIRAAAEIVGFARLSQVNRHHVFSLRDFVHPYYSDPDGTYGGSAVARASAVQAGWLSLKSGTYGEDNAVFQIEPADFAYVDIQSLIDAGYLGQSERTFLGWIELKLETKYTFARMAKGTGFDFARTVQFARAPVDEQGRKMVRPATGGSLNGVLVFANATPKRRTRDPHSAKKIEFVFETTPGTREALEISKKAFERFLLVHTKPGRNKREAEGSWKILEPMVREGKEIPVFYVGRLSNTGEPDFAFGLTRLFKIPHRFSVGEVIERQDAHKLMRKGANRFEPDFVEALFGFVHEARDLGRDESNEGEALKGRVAFSGARIKAEGSQEPVEREVFDTVMMTPRASFAPFYLKGTVKDWSDENTLVSGRKIYPARFAHEDKPSSLSVIRKRLAQQINALPPEMRGKKELRSRLKFLVDGSGGELRFSSRIKLHNVTAEEVGLLLFVLTHGGVLTHGDSDAKPYRHMLGRAKPFGAGQLRVVSARLALEANVRLQEGASRLQPPSEKEQAGANREGFCPPPSETKPSFSHKPFLDAFVGYMRRPGSCGGNDAEKPANFLNSVPIRQFLGGSDPSAAAGALPRLPSGRGEVGPSPHGVTPDPRGDNYLRLRYDQKTERGPRAVNPYQELRRATQLLKETEDPARDRPRFLPAPQ
jgi:CRISPR-associated protein (TIGR03986 family)